MNKAPDSNSPRVALTPEMIRKLNEQASKGLKLPPDSDPVAQRWLREEMAHPQLDARDVVGVRIKNPEYTVITDPAHASVMAERHQILNRQKEVLNAGLPGRTIQEEAQKAEKRLLLHQQIWDSGAFFENYTTGDEEDRIEASVLDELGMPIDPDEAGWLMIESSGRLTRATQELDAEKTVGGDMQIFLHSARSRKLVKELRLGEKPEDTVDRNAAQLWGEIMRNPAMVAWISDVCSLRGTNAFPGYFPPVGFASAASEGAFREIRKLNAFRDQKIRWAVSAVAEVRQILDSRKRILATFEPSLINQQGINLTRRARIRKADNTAYRNMLLGVQRNRLLKVVFPEGTVYEGRTGYLNFDWHELAQEIYRDGDEVAEQRARK